MQVDHTDGLHRYIIHMNYKDWLNTRIMLTDHTNGSWIHGSYRHGSYTDGSNRRIIQTDYKNGSYQLIIRTNHTHGSCKQIIQMDHTNESYWRIIQTDQTNGSCRRIIPTDHTNGIIQTNQSNRFFRWIIWTDQYEQYAWLFGIYEENTRWIIQPIFRETVLYSRMTRLMKGLNKLLLKKWQKNIFLQESVLSQSKKSFGQ